MNTYNNLINNLEALELFRFKENIDTYLDMIADGEKTALDALCELTDSEIDCKRSNPCTLTFKRPLTTVFLFSDVFWQLW